MKKSLKASIISLVLAIGLCFSLCISFAFASAEGTYYVNVTDKCTITELNDGYRYENIKDGTYYDGPHAITFNKKLDLSKPTSFDFQPIIGSWQGTADEPNVWATHFVIMVNDDLDPSDMSDATYMGNTKGFQVRFLRAGNWGTWPNFRIDVYGNSSPIAAYQSTAMYQPHDLTGGVPMVENNASYAVAEQTVSTALISNQKVHVKIYSEGDDYVIAFYYYDQGVLSENYFPIRIPKNNVDFANNSPYLSIYMQYPDHSASIQPSSLGCSVTNLENGDIPKQYSSIVCKVDGEEIQQSGLSMTMGTQKQIVAKSIDAQTGLERDDDVYSYESDNPTIATVNSTGLITAGMTTGTANITVSDSEGWTQVFAVNVTAKYSEIVVRANEQIIGSEGVSIDKNSTLQLSVTSKLTSNGQEDNGDSYSYESLSQSIVTVSDTGLITAGNSLGEAIIRITNSEGLSKEISVIVTASDLIYDEIVVRVNGEIVDESGLEIDFGETIQLQVTSKLVSNGQEVSTDSYSYLIDNSSLASVDQTGLIIANSIAGSTTITISNTQNLTKIIPITIRVQQTGTLEMIVSAIELKIGDNSVNKLSVISSYTGSLTWTSSNEEIVSVDNNGYLTIKNIGTATIKATDSNGEFAQCVVTVSDSTPLEFTEIIVRENSEIIGDLGVRLEENATLQLNTTSILALSGLEVDFDSYTYQSLSNAIATVDGNGKITAISSGSTKIIITNSEGLTKEINVRVYLPGSLVEITLNFTTLEMNIGETNKLIVIETGLNLAWESSDAEVVEVDSDGNIWAYANGKATITVKDLDSGLTAQCVVTVGTGRKDRPETGKTPDIPTHNSTDENGSAEESLGCGSSISIIPSLGAMLVVVACGVVIKKKHNDKNQIKK